MAKASRNDIVNNQLMEQNNVGPVTLRRHLVRGDTMSRQWMGSNSVNAMTELCNAVALKKKILTGVRVCIDSDNHCVACQC